MTLSIARIERGAYRTWSPDETVEIGGWLVGSNGGFTRRANSANARGPADTTVDTGAQIRQWLALRGAPMAVRITPLVPDDVSATAAQTWDLVPADETPVLVRPFDERDGGGDPDPADVQLIDPTEEAFMDELISFNRRPDAARPIWRRMVARLDEPNVGMWIPGKAVGIAAIAESIAFVYSVAVADEHRRRGLASQVMAAAHAFAGQHHADATALQVFGRNTAALGLYARLGYRERYRYHYLQEAPPKQA